MRFKKLIGTFRVLVTVGLMLCCSCCSATRPSIWYYAWNNTLADLESAADDEIVPALINGQNYRILKISNFSGRTFKNFSYKSTTSTVEMYQLPLIKDHTDRKVLDLIKPLTVGELFEDQSTDRYFLLKFKGIREGQENIILSIATDKKTYYYAKKVKTSAVVYTPPISLNVFAYFDYNFLIKDLKNQVIRDLVRHNNNVLVIPPNALPSLAQGNFNTSALRNYLKGTENKFKYYILYFNFNNHLIDLKNPTLKRNIPLWYKSIMDIFAEYHIPVNNVLLFPYDEPKDQQITRLTELHSYFRSIGIQNPFFVTVDNQQAGKALLNKIEFIQMQPEIMKLLETSNSRSQLWTYQLIYGSRDRVATEYRDISITAFRHDAKGIGVWSYADVDRAVDAKGKAEFSRGTGTWDIGYAAPSAEYSLIYRKKNTLYSSLRWEALAYGMEDYFWLQLHRNKFGTSQNNEILKRIDHLSEKERDDLKLRILNQ